MVCWLLWGSLLFGRPDIFKVLHTGAYHLPTPGQHIRANRDRVLRSSLTDAKDLEGKLCYASLLLHVTRPCSLPDAAAKMQLMEWILNVKKSVDHRYVQARNGIVIYVIIYVIIYVRDKYIYEQTFA